MARDFNDEDLHDDIKTAALGARYERDAVGAAASVSAADSTSSLILSEIVEGSSFNKAVEFYNGTGAEIDLAAENYVLSIYFNGSTSPGAQIALTGTVAAGEVFVLADDGAAAEILAVADQTSTSNFFNGDDAVVLTRNGEVVDSFGQIGTDPGAEWAGGGQNDTLRRVAAPDTDASDAFDTAEQWEASGTDDFSDLGSHQVTPEGGVFISEIVEGSSFNKAVELYNDTGEDIDLAAGNYVLSFYFNGNTTAATQIALTGTIAAGETYVLADDGAVAEILAVADQTSTANFFNGDDAIVLTRDGEVVDSFGQVGTDPGSEWSGGGQNDTLRRAAAPDTETGDAFDAAAQWDVFGTDDFSDLGSYGDAPSPEAGKVLLSEIVVTPTGGEFIEIHNAGDAAIDLSNLYLTDATFAPGGTFYYNLPTGSNAGGGGFSDFLARFPDGATIASGEYLTIAMAGSADFLVEYEFAPDFELFDDGSDDGESVMREGLPGSINGQGGLTNSGEVVVLFEWDGESDLVADHDYVVWGDKDEAVDKTGVEVDGPDADSGPSAYRPDTAVADQEAVSSGAHGSGNSFQRIDLTEGSQTATGGNGITGGDETSENLSETWAELKASPGEAAPDENGGEVLAVEISKIQGSSGTSPLVGQRVKVDAVVTLLAPALGGFFIQEETGDGNAATSEGVFVFADYSDTGVEVGDLIEIEADVGEYFEATQLGGSLDIEVLAKDVGVPAATQISLPLAEGADRAAVFEAVEGMLVEIIAGDGERLTVTDTYTAFGEVGVTSGDVLYQSTQLAPSFSDAQEAIAEANARDFLKFENALDDSLSSAPRAGDGIVGDKIVGAMHYTFDEYKVETANAVEFDESVNPYPRTDEPEDVGGSLNVASFNVLNYFTTLTSEDSDARGAATAAELEIQTTKIVAALEAIDADVVGLIEIENDLDPTAAPDEATAYLVDRLNEALGDEVYDYIPTGKVGTDAIKQAFIYKIGTVEPLGDAAILDTEAFVSPYTPGDPQSRPAIAQTFKEIGTGEIFTASVNHLKSKGSTTGAVVDGEADDNPVEGSAALTRVAAAKELSEWLAGDPTGSGDPDQLILGDLNSYAMERAIVALEEEGYTDLLRLDEGTAEVFSYAFDGEFGTLDYAMANESLTAQVTGTSAWHVNSVESYSIQYNGSDFAELGDLGPWASSDHDPIIVGLDLDSREMVVGDAGSGPVFGTDADDVIDGQGGRADLARGFGGSDVFRFTDTEGARDALNIIDYEVGVDLIDLAGEAVANSRALGSNLRIELDGPDGDYVFVRGVTDLDEIDFYDDGVAVA